MGSRTRGQVHVGDQDKCCETPLLNSSADGPPQQRVHHKASPLKRIHSQASRPQGKWMAGRTYSPPVFPGLVRLGRTSFEWCSALWSSHSAKPLALWSSHKCLSTFWGLWLRKLFFAPGRLAVAAACAGVSGWCGSHVGHVGNHIYQLVWKMCL